MHEEASAFLKSQAEHPSKEESVGSIKRDIPPTIFDAIYQSNLPDQEKSLGRLAQEGFVILAAGSDTTSRALTYGMYHLVTNPQFLERLRGELLTVMPELKDKPPLKVLEGLPLLVSSDLIDMLLQ
jgi:cytochrome P450